MDDRFRVGAAAVDVTLCLQALSMCAMVVDFTIEDNPDRSILVGHRLVAGRRQVNDREAAESEAQTVIRTQIRACTVRPAVNHGVSHGSQQIFGDSRLYLPVSVDARNATHLSSLRPS